MSKTIQNPIIRGFNPDPSILRVEDDYYVVTSTFEWFPAVKSIIPATYAIGNWSVAR